MPQNLRRKKVLMLAFELAPLNSGGLGVAVLDLTKALSKYVDITFLLPERLPYKHKHMKIIFAEDIFGTKHIDENDQNAINKKISNRIAAYDKRDMNTLFQVGYANVTKTMIDRALKEDFDVIHCHDWMTVEAGLKISEVSGKPLILQIHATEFDRAPIEGVDRYKMGLEKLGMEKSVRVVAVSNYTKNLINKYYQIPLDKIEVVHNATDLYPGDTLEKLTIDRPVVLSLGRITYQKGINHLIEAARIVVKDIPDALFVIVGNGDMYQEVIENAASKGLSGNIVFTGFLRGKEREIIYNSTDVFVMPSISEPFGLVAIEAANYNIPTVVSRQSGVAEVLEGAHVVDFWDINLMAKKITKLLKSNRHKRVTVKKQRDSLVNLSWDNSAIKLETIYSQITN